MKILHPPPPRVVQVWWQPVDLQLSLSAPAALVASAPWPGACRLGRHESPEQTSARSPAGWEPGHFHFKF